MRAALALCLTGGGLVVNMRAGAGYPCVAFGFELGALDAPDRMPAGSHKSCGALAVPGWRARPVVSQSKLRGAS